jgi:hypothetical protein
MEEILLGNPFYDSQELAIKFQLGGQIAAGEGRFLNQSRGAKVNSEFSEKYEPHQAKVEFEMTCPLPKLIMAIVDIGSLFGSSMNSIDFIEAKLITSFAAEISSENTHIGAFGLKSLACSKAFL